MVRNVLIVLLAVVVVALPFVFRGTHGASSEWREGDPELIVVTVHNEAIRYEFARAFSDWHQARHGRPVRVDWRVVGGTTETVRYLRSEITSSFRAWWMAQGNKWPGNGEELMFGYKLERSRASGIHQALRRVDDPAAFGTQIDVFFGGGEYDHSKIGKLGITVAPWAGDLPAGLFADAEGRELVPERMSGELWRSPTVIGNTVSTFGFCYNLDRLAELEVEPPRHWRDLTDPKYFRRLGTADPTKSGSITKAFEMIIHQQVHEAVRRAGYVDDEIEAIEAGGDFPGAYAEAVSAGWLEGVRLVQRIGANARYFTDSSSKVPIDVGAGDVAVGMCIDFFGRYQSEFETAADGTPRLVYLTPAGGSSVSCDPLTLMRGAPNRETAVRFIEFVLSEDGQKLWCYRPGTPGGPEKFALRRMPIRRDFFGPDNPHAQYASEDLSRADIDPYQLAETFVYRGRWTGRLFNLHRTLIRAMCLDSGEELRAAWGAIIDRGGPEENPDAMALMTRMPEGLNWTDAQELGGEDLARKQREWTAFFRRSYREARAAVR